MADPFAIVGLATSILTLVDFGTKVVSLAKSIREAHDGAIPEAEELDLILHHVRSLSSTLLNSQTAQNLSQDERKVISMAAKCDGLARELSDILETLKVRDTAWSKTIETGRVVFQAMRKKKTIDSLQARLAYLDNSLREAVNGTLQQSRDSAILFELKALRSIHQELAIDYDSSLDDIQSDILGLTKVDRIELLSGEQLSQLKERLDSFAGEYKSRRHTSQILQRLNFVEIRRRWDRIPDTEKNTNTWIFDRAKSSFLDWLEAGRGIFWITGKAGSGKSTLMKFLSDHRKTEKALKKWADPKKLHATSYYFWNQGFELQKSQRGLLRTLLFQILKNTPNSVPAVCSRLPEEDWKVEELKTMLRKVVKLDGAPARFCFFIDGLDEYHGDEEDLVDILSFFSDTLDVKLCVSSRPRLVLDEAFAARRENLIISDFTIDDMKTFVRSRLEVNHKFRRLQASGPACEEIMTQIAEASKGVWLWVYLITHDLVRAVNRNEGIPMLLRILDQFPKELEDYFRFIIDSVKPPYREEMAQIFLITIDEVQPLPLFAFSLLERERSNANYAIAAPITPLDSGRIEEDEKIMKDRLQNRCRDLLVVEEGAHPVFLSRPVDFLHRTVRDFLRDCYYNQLKRELASNFDPLVSLCNMMLFLVKGLPAIDIQQSSSITRLLQIVDELLYYVHEVEKRRHTRFSMWNHWTHIRDSPGARGYDEYREGGNCNFLALAVQARLTKYVYAKLADDSDQLHKSGRPLLDYALRPRRVTSLTMPYHSQRAEAGIDIGMVRLLLNEGANPNQQVHLNDGRTVWALFLVSCYESERREEVSPVVKDVWYRASELLIRHGAEQQCWLGADKGMNFEEVLRNAFGADKAGILQRLLAEEKARRENHNRSFLSWFSPSAWLPG
ncbi:hypothetical protein V8C37DRAFT_413714 [Trichoderma ceciliae]